MRIRARRIFFGWYIVGAGSAIEFVVALAIAQVFGGYAAALTREFGWSRGSLGLGFSIARLENGILGPLQGWLIDRFGPGTMMRVGLLILAGGFVAFSRIDSIPGFYVSFGIMAIGTGTVAFTPISVAVVRWFKRYRGSALGLAQIGYSIAGLAAPFIILAITTIGWRQVAVASAVGVLVFGLPLTTLVHGYPHDRGLRVDGLSEEQEKALAEADRLARRERPAVVDFTAREALRTRAFWLLALGHMSALLVVNSVQVHLFLHLTGSGHSDALAAAFLGLLVVGQIGGQVTGGYLADRFDKRRIAIACLGMHGGALLLVAHFGSVPTAVIAFSLVHGVAWGIRGPLMQAIRADYFGGKSFGVIMGFAGLVTMLGAIVGPFLAGVLYDATGSYTVGFTVLAVLAGLGSIFFVLAKPPTPPARAVDIGLDPPAVRA